jgi:hypothetical protein
MPTLFFWTCRLFINCDKIDVYPQIPQKGVSKRGFDSKSVAFALRIFKYSRYAALIAYCQREQVSPGGSADLLAVSLFFSFAERQAFDIPR